MKYVRLAGAALVLVAAAACTKPAAPEATSAAVVAGTSESAVQPADAVSLFNAYTARSLNAEAQATDPAKEFSKAEPVYIGAVVHGESGSATIKAEWSLNGGPVLGSAEKSSPIRTAEVVTLAPIPGGSLEKGSYMAIVSLNGQPRWELPFQITD